MGTDHSSKFSMDNSTTFKGKLNQKCSNCGKVLPYYGERKFCPYCKKRYVKFTIKNSQGQITGGK